MKNMLVTAMKSQELMMIFYLDKKGNVSQRIIKVEAIKGDKIKAYCYWRKQKRIFSLGNILSVGKAKKAIGA
jgi:hypothetical protein